MRSEGRNSNGFQLTNDAGEGNFEKKLEVAFKHPEFYK